MYSTRKGGAVKEERMTKWNKNRSLKEMRIKIRRKWTTRKEEINLEPFEMWSMDMEKNEEY